MTDEELRSLTKLARQKIHKSGIGRMHSMWDAIFDAECILAGEPSIVSRECVEKSLAGFVGEI